MDRECLTFMKYYNSGSVGRFLVEILEWPSNTKILYDFEAVFFRPILVLINLYPRIRGTQQPSAAWGPQQAALPPWTNAFRGQVAAATMASNPTHRPANTHLPTFHAVNSRLQIELCFLFFLACIKYRGVFFHRFLDAVYLSVVLSFFAPVDATSRTGT